MLCHSMLCRSMLCRSMLSMLFLATLCLSACGASPAPSTDEPVAAEPEPPAPRTEPTTSSASPRCPLVTSVGETVPQSSSLSRDLAGPEGHIDYDAHAREIAAALHAFFEADLSALPEPERHGDPMTPRGPWPTAPYPCIEDLARLDFDRGGSAMVEVELRLEGGLDVEMVVWKREGSWRPHTLPDVAGARRIREVQSWLERTPEVDLVSVQQRHEHRMVRVRDSGGSTICVVRAERDPLCWRDPRPIAVLGAGSWWPPREEGEADEAEAEAEDDEDEDDEGDSEPDAPPLLELTLGPWAGEAELWHVDADARMRRAAGRIPMALPTADAEPFWSGSTNVSSGERTATLGPWESVGAMEAPWLAPLTHLDVSVVASRATTPALVITSAHEPDSDATLCVRHGGQWRCGTFDVTREDWELERYIERVEPLGDALLVQSSMRMDGGNGDGSGAYGSSELYVVVSDGAALRVAGWIPLGGMTWVTENRCRDDGNPCYFRAIRRAHYPWSVSGECLELASLRAEQGTADGSFVLVRRAGGRAAPTRRLRGGAARAVVALGFPDDEATTAIEPPTEDLTGTWRWDGTTLVRGTARRGDRS